MAGFAGGFLQGLGGGMQARQDRLARDKALALRSQPPQAQAPVMPMPGSETQPPRAMGVLNGNGDYFTRVRQGESGGNDAARNPRSTATGRYQFIQSTWDGLRRDHPDLELTPDGRLDPEQQTRAMRRFTQLNATALERARIPVTDANLYAAHFLGAGGASSVLRAPDSAPMSSLVSSQVISANPHLRNMMAADFRRWTERVAGTGSTFASSAAPQDRHQPQEPGQRPARPFGWWVDQGRRARERAS